MSVINKNVGGKITNCIVKGVPIRTIWPPGGFPGGVPGYPSVPKCRPRLCLTYINPADPLSCSYNGSNEWYKWYWGEYQLPPEQWLSAMINDPCSPNGGGKLVNNLINFQWNFQRRNIYTNENLSNVFSSIYNKDSAIKITTGFGELGKGYCTSETIRDSFRIGYSVDWHVCRDNVIITYSKSIDENTSPYDFEILAKEQADFRYRSEFFISAEVIPISQCAVSKYEISHSVGIQLLRYGQNRPYDRRGWGCGYQELNPIFGEVLYNYSDFTFMLGNPPNNTPSLTMPIDL